VAFLLELLRGILELIPPATNYEPGKGERIFSKICVMFIGKRLPWVTLFRNMGGPVPRFYTYPVLCGDEN